jgi:hypothetical protein
MQGFLFAAFSVVANALVTQRQERGSLLWLVMIGAALVGFLSPWFVWTSLQSAFQHMRDVTRWWNENWAGPTKIGSVAYPPIRGIPWSPGRLGVPANPSHYEPRVSRLSRKLSPLLNPRGIPILISMVWLVLIAGALAYAPVKPEAKAQKVTVAGSDGKSTVTIEVNGK